MTIKHSLKTLTKTRSKALPPMPPPENINGKRGTIIWGTEGSGAGGTATGSRSAAPDATLPAQMTVQTQPDISRPTEFLGIPESTKNIAKFKILGRIKNPRLTDYELTARMDDNNDLWLETKFKGDVIDSVNLGRPSLDLTAVGGDDRIEAFFRYHYDYDGRHYGTRSMSVISRSATSTEYLLQSVVNLPRNFIVMKNNHNSDYHRVVLKDGFGGLSYLSRVYMQGPWTDGPVRHYITDPLSMLSIENSPSNARLHRIDRQLMLAATSGSYEGYMIRSIYYNNAYLAGRPFNYSPGPKDFFKVTVSSTGQISASTLHEASLEDYIPFLTNLAPMQAPPVSLSSKPYSFYDFEIGREYRSKVDATILNEEVVFTELSAKYRDTMVFNIDFEGWLTGREGGGPWTEPSNWIVPSNLQLCIYYRGNKAEINRMFGRDVKDYDEHDSNWGGLYGANVRGYSVSGTLGEAGRISESYADNCYGFVGFFINNRIRLGPSILRLAEDEDGVYVELWNNTNPGVREKFYL